MRQKFIAHGTQILWESCLVLCGDRRGAMGDCGQGGEWYGSVYATRHALPPITSSGSASRPPRRTPDDRDGDETGDGAVARVLAVVNRLRLPCRSFALGLPRVAAVRCIIFPVSWATARPLPHFWGQPTIERHQSPSSPKQARHMATLSQQYADARSCAHKGFRMYTQRAQEPWLFGHIPTRCHERIVSL